MHCCNKSKNRKPLWVGFIRPHTPLIVPKRFFDMFPVNEISLPEILDGDVDDTFAQTIRGLPDGKEPDSVRTEDMGSKLFHKLVESYDSRDEALRLLSKPILPALRPLTNRLVGFWMSLIVLNSKTIRSLCSRVITVGEWVKKTISMVHHFGRRAHESHHIAPRSPQWTLLRTRFTR